MQVTQPVPLKNVREEHSHILAVGLYFKVAGQDSHSFEVELKNYIPVQTVH